MTDYIYDFLLAFCSNYVPILHRFILRHSNSCKIGQKSLFHTPYYVPALLVFGSRARVTALKFQQDCCIRKLGVRMLPHNIDYMTNA